MSIEIIKVIKEAESKAENIKKEALQGAKQIITDANIEASRILDEARQVAEARTKDVLNMAESEGQLLYDEIISKASKECENILNIADKNMDDAASIIVERIVKANGNS